MDARDLLERAISACLGVLMAGCAIHIPPPAVKVQETEVRFLQPGTTTRDEVLQRLGQPNVLGGKRFGVYEWLSATGIGIVGFGAGGAGGGGYASETGRNRSRLLVEFDEGGRLRHFAFAEYRLPGVYFKVPPGEYFVDGSALELPRTSAPLLKPGRSLGQPFTGFWSPHDLQSSALTLSRDGRYVAVAPVSSDIQVWDLSTGDKRTFATGFKPSRLVRAMDVSRDGKMLAAAGFEFDDATVLWDMASGVRLHVLRGHGKTTSSVPAGPTTVQIAPDGRTVATGGHDGMVKLWDVASGKETSAIATGRGTVRSLAFAPRGDLLAVGTSRGAVIVVDLADGKQATILHGYGESESPVLAGRQVAFSPSGELLAANDCVAVELWPVSDIRRSAAADKQLDPATAFLLPYGKRAGCPFKERTFLAFSPDDAVLIASANLYSVWDLRLRRLLTAWDPAHDVHEPADLTLGPGSALLAWSDSQGKRFVPTGVRIVQIMDLAPIIRESMEGRERARTERTAK